MKKIITAAIAATLLAGQGAAALAAGQATASAPLLALPDRTAAPVGEAEGAIGPAGLLLLFAALGAGIVVLIETGGSSDEDPASP